MTLLEKIAKAKAYVKDVHDKAWSDGESYGYYDGHEQGLEEGTAQGIAAMWAASQCDGSRTDYQMTYQYQTFSADTFLPQFNFNVTAANHMFYKATDRSGNGLNMTQIEKQQGISLDFSNCATLARAFASNLFCELNVVDLSSATNTTQTFAGNSYKTLKKINKLIFSEDTVIASDMFVNASELEEVICAGVIASSISFQWSKNLTAKSARSVLLALKDFSGTSKAQTVKVTIPAVAWESLNSTYETPNGEADWQQYAEEKGWTY